LSIEELNAYYTIREGSNMEEGIVLEETTSINDKSIHTTDWAIFPNPTNGQFSIEFVFKS